ncbi:MAG: hypothetical protein IKY67_06210 [Paludibacteraceae bacterium]|nr:hypothetical protein [Paludibacteraceae bacterium]
MAFKKVVPEWHATGSEPPDSLKTSGFQAGYKPPAAYFNWYWHGMSEAVKELQEMKPEDIGLGNVPNVKTNDQTPTYTQSSTLAKLISGEKLSVAMGKIAKAVSELISHIDNEDNPHGLSVEQIGAFPANGITYGTTPLTDGVSSLPTGHIYLQYEE